MCGVVTATERNNRSRLTHLLQTRLRIGGKLPGSSAITIRARNAVPAQQGEYKTAVLLPVTFYAKLVILECSYKAPPNMVSLETWCPHGVETWLKIRGDHHPDALVSSIRLNAEYCPGCGASLPVEKYATPVPLWRSSHKPASSP